MVGFLFNCSAKIGSAKAPVKEKSMAEKENGLFNAKQAWKSGEMVKFDCHGPLLWLKT